MTREGSFGCYEVDTATGEASLIIEKSWWANHYHYCPHDEAWIGFCCEGETTTVPQRVWGYHAELAPAGKPLLDQHWETPGERMCVGHERWCFHDRSVVAVAYGQSAPGFGGIYEAFVDGRPSRQIGVSGRDWHVNVSRDGRWAVVDTTGPHDAPGRSWESAAQVSDVLVMDMTTGARQFVARSRQYRHPSHPHPIFSPDGQWIFYNEADEALSRNRVMRVRNPWFDPAS
jgi:hypothetical protein